MTHSHSYSIFSFWFRCGFVVTVLACVFLGSSCAPTADYKGKGDRLAKASIKALQEAKPIYTLVAPYKEKDTDGNWKEDGKWLSVSLAYNLDISTNEIRSSIDSRLVPVSQFDTSIPGEYAYKGSPNVEGFRAIYINQGQRMANGLSLKLDATAQGSSVLVNMRIKK